MKEGEVLISVDNISKKFTRSFKRSLMYGLQDIFSDITGRSIEHEKLRKDEFLAVDNVSFELRRGECIGLIGPNGAGKSTLLKLLNGLVKPDHGKISIRGRVGALISLGAGFNPILTGRENIYINGSVLGFTKKEIDHKLDKIIDFSEISDFIDTPVQSYSSGMHVRLGFAIAIQMDPDVLLIDEVLAVGDAGFRSKCYNAIYEINKKAAVIFVSHTMPHISRLCSHLMVLEKGKDVYNGNNVPFGIEKYFDLFGTEQGKIIEVGTSKITNVHLSAREINNYYVITFGDDLIVEFDAQVDEKYSKLEANISISSHGMELVAQCNSKNNKVGINNFTGIKHFRIIIPDIRLNPGTYYLSLSIVDGVTNDILIWHYATIKLKVTGDFFGGAPIQFVGEWNIS